MLNCTFNGFTLTGDDCTEKVISWEETFDQIIDSPEIADRPGRLSRDRKNLVWTETIVVERTHDDETEAARFIRIFNDALTGVGQFQITVPVSATALHVHEYDGGPEVHELEAGPIEHESDSTVEFALRTLTNASAKAVSHMRGCATRHTVVFTGS